MAILARTDDTSPLAVPYPLALYIAGPASPGRWMKAQFGLDGPAALVVIRIIENGLLQNLPGT